jgi:putative transposase
LVRRKWTVKRPNPGGRPRIDPELEGWIVRLAGENPRWGFDRIHGELLKLGFTLDPKTVKNVMKRHHLPPAPERDPTRSNWRTFLSHYRTQMLACDFFMDVVGESRIKRGERQRLNEGFWRVVAQQASARYAADS